MAAVTSVPAVVLALRDLWQPIADANDVPLSVGVPPGGDVPDRYLAVAYGGDDRPGIVGRAVQPTMGNPGQQAAEEFSVWCTLTASSGDQDAAALMGQVAAWFALLGAALRANRQLSGAVIQPGYADLANYEWQLEQGGQITTVFFVVDVIQRWL